MTPTIVAEGLDFPEGPVWLGPQRVAVTEIRGQCISVWENGTLKRRVAVTGGGANGATLGADGALYVANNGGVSLGHEGKWMAPQPLTGRIQRATLDGKVTDVATKLPGDAPNRPNDICFGPDGLLYYTDPHNWEDLPEVKPGRVARTTLDGRQVRILRTRVLEATAAEATNAPSLHIERGRVVASCGGGGKLLILALEVEGALVAADALSAWTAPTGLLLLR